VQNKQTRAQNLVGLPKLTVLTLQRLQSISQFGRNPRPFAAIDFHFLDPLIERLWRAADLRGYRYNCRPPRRVLGLVVQNHPHCTGADLSRKLVCRFACHGSILSGVGASDQPGAVQLWGLSRRTRAIDHLLYESNSGFLRWVTGGCRNVLSIGVFVIASTRPPRKRLVGLGQP
jgi:hypothetical protein